ALHGRAGESHAVFFDRKPAERPQFQHDGSSDRFLTRLSRRRCNLAHRDPPGESVTVTSPGGVMRAIRSAALSFRALIAAGSLVLGVALLAGCTERSAPTGITEKRGPTFSADATGAKASVVFDAIGDAVWNQNTGPGSFAKVPAWLDIASASITLKGLRFIFDEELAAPVPADPALDPDIPPQIDHVCFAGYGLDADPTTAPVGYPFTKNEPNNQEFYVFVCWNPTGSFGVGTGFIGFVVDRRPLL